MSNTAPAGSDTSGMMFPKPGPKRPPMKAGQHRRTGVKKRREEPRRGPWRSKEYRTRVRELECAAPNAPVGCRGPKTCSHLDQGLKEKGMGMKTSDKRTCCHCWGHNSDWDNHEGAFAGWTDAERERYADEAIHETQVLLGLRQAA